MKPLEEKASPAREANATSFVSVDIPSLTSYNAASVSNHCFEPAPTAGSLLEFPGSILETYGDDSGYRCSLDSVLGSLLVREMSYMQGTCTQQLRDPCHILFQDVPSGIHEGLVFSKYFATGMVI